MKKTNQFPIPGIRCLSGSLFSEAIWERWQNETILNTWLHSTPEGLPEEWYVTANPSLQQGIVLSLWYHLLESICQLSLEIKDFLWFPWQQLVKCTAVCGMRENKLVFCGKWSYKDKAHYFVWFAFCFQLSFWSCTADASEPAICHS